MPVSECHSSVDWKIIGRFMWLKAELHSHCIYFISASSSVNDIETTVSAKL